MGDEELVEEVEVVEDSNQYEAIDKKWMLQFHRDMSAMRDWFNVNVPILEQLMVKSGLAGEMQIVRPCGYCKGKASAIGNDASGWRVHCETANCTVGPSRTDKGAAIKAWNSTG